MATPLWQAVQPFSLNSWYPFSCCAVSALPSPFSQRSKGALGVIRVSSKAAMASVTSRG